VTGEFHALGRHAIEVRCFQNLLPEASQVAVAEIVGKNEDDIGRRSHRGAAENREKQQDKSEVTAGEAHE